MNPILKISEGGRWPLYLLFAATAVACEPISDASWSPIEDAPIFKAREVTLPDASQPDQLRVLAWNIKYGAGRIPFWFDCWGDRVQLTPSEVSANMEGIYALIREADPDVLMVEEIELNSRRSNYYDMVQGILDNTSLNYGAYFETWDSRYVPSEGLGRMNLGNALFSKYPINRALRIAQPDRTDLDALTETFYLHRAIGRVDLDLGDLTLAAFVVHTEAYDEDGTKRRQLEQIHAVLSEVEGPFVVGGDFNELPPTALQLEGFADERTEPLCSDEFEQPPYTPEAMAPFYQDFTPWISLDRYGDDQDSQSKYFTHSLLGPDERNEAGQAVPWNRTLDYLFADKDSAWQVGSTDVLQEAGQTVGELSWSLEADPRYLSDHTPVFGILEVTR